MALRSFLGRWMVVAVVVLGIAPSATAGTTHVGGSANLVQPAIITAEQALQLLQSATPGVFTLSFPDLSNGPLSSTGAHQDNGLILTGLSAQRSGATLVFSVGSENAAALDRLIEALGLPNLDLALEGMSSTALLATSLNAYGYIDRKGFQIAVMQIVRTLDGGGYISTIILFN